MCMQSLSKNQSSVVTSISHLLYRQEVQATNKAPNMQQSPRKNQVAISINTLKFIHSISFCIHIFLSTFWHTQTSRAFFLSLIYSLIIFTPIISSCKHVHITFAKLHGEDMLTDLKPSPRLGKIEKSCKDKRREEHHMFLYILCHIQ